MSFRHQQAARFQAVQGGPHTRAVLWLMCFHACEFCGLSWPGVPLLVRESQISKTRVRDSLDELVAAGLMRVHAYPNGGRGRTTEYLVLPATVPATLAPPCNKCRGNLKLPRGEYGAA